ncbi:uncharacterized protein LOC110728769 [Chenopodium quinoa]|uniref:uncharacterized protein LOC110728769 n=1 Tax=Chenopodium quinoa TaxID=63459 RepID=UPI000B7992C8|nr:uncharacterized protein LOC110728769 [Chenopodium quinoa]
MSVEKYTREFEKLSIMSGVEEAPEHKISRYIGGLERKLGQKVDVHAHGSFDQVVQVALKFEKYDKVSSDSGYPKPTFKNSFAPKGETSKPIVKDDKGKAPMHFPNKDDHNKMGNRKTCYKCRGYGHFSNECPNSRAMMIREMDDDKYEDEKRDFGDPIYDEEDEIVVDADEGQILVVRRALHSISTPLAEEQREKIFQTRCTIKDRVCNLIIDSGSCTNVASTTFVSKLNLETTDHPTPYKLQWLNNHNEVKVTKQTLFSFSIGKLYKDEVLCDVLPMDACHILLGRPWQFDRDVMHDGRKNTYSFMRDKKKIVLNPLSPTIKHKEPLGTGNTIKENLLIGENEMEKEINQGHIGFICLLRETKESERENPIHPLVKEVLVEYHDVFPDDLPPGLPPIRGIEHQIDLIPRSQLPNRPAYRCTRDEAGELQRQVGELIERGFVRESLSPCSVPALLVPKKDGTWRICVDSRVINNITIKYRFPIPRLDDMLDELHGSKVFSKIDLRMGKCEIDHAKHLRQVFETLRSRRLFAKLEKCTFMVDSIVFLGYVILNVGISMEPSKVEAIQSWPTPTTLTQVRSFHGLASFYRRFVKNFSTIFAPVAKCMKKGTFEWTPSAQRAFENLKKKLCEAPILALSNFDQPFEVECDASGVRVGAVLVQGGRPVPILVRSFVEQE